MKKLLLSILACNFLNAQTVTNYISTGITTPSGICFDNNGNLIVGELNSYKIFRYNAALTKTDLTPNYLNGAPNQLAFNILTNEIWFATENSSAISKLTSTNVLTEYFASGGPYGVAIDAQGNIFYSEFFGKKIKKRQPDGTTTDFITGLQSPTSMAFDLNGNLLVAESLNNRILKITSAGISTILMTNLPNVRQIVVNTNGDIYVGGGTFSDIYRLQNGQTTQSTFLTNIPCRGMAIKNNELYISDATNNKILKVSLPTLELNNFSKETSLNVYPNPTKGIINIETKEALTVYVYDLLGRKVLESKIDETKNQINLNNLSGGTYLIKTRNEVGKGQSTKVVVE